MTVRSFEIHDGEGSLFDDEEGEGLVGFPLSGGRRQQLEQTESDSSVPRLSRDLEEGFQDESDDEDDVPNRAITPR